MRHNGKWAALIAGLLAAGPAHAAPAPALQAQILVEDSGGAGKIFVGYVTSPQPFEGRYELIGEKRGAAGSARVRQAGAVKSVNAQAVRLSHIAFGSIAADDHYVVQLKIFQGKELISQVELKK